MCEGEEDTQRGGAYAYGGVVGGGVWVDVVELGALGWGHLEAGSGGLESLGWGCAQKIKDLKGLRS